MQTPLGRVNDFFLLDSLAENSTKNWEGWEGRRNQLYDFM